MWKDAGIEHVYFAFDRIAAVIKVGRTTEWPIKKRMMGLQGQSGDKHPLEVLGAVEGGKVLEAKFHRILEAYRKPGHKEWFYAVPFVFGVVDEAMAAADPNVWADAHTVWYPITPPPNNGASCVVVPVSVDGTARQRPVPGTSIPSLAVLKENIR